MVDVPASVRDQSVNQIRCTVIADLNRGESVEQVAGYLVAEGWDAAVARAFVEEVQREENTAAAAMSAGRTPAAKSPRDVARATGARNMRIGGLWVAGGVGLTTLTFMAANGGGGGRYFVFHGAMLYGAVRFLIGVVTYIKA